LHVWRPIVGSAADTGTHFLLCVHNRLMSAF
jgi:hypothetical protein